MSEISKRNISCQIHYVTLGKDDVAKDVDVVLNMIVNSGLDYKLGQMSTLVKGDYRTILKLIDEIMTMSVENKFNFLINTSFSNSCGMAQGYIL